MSNRPRSRPKYGWARFRDETPPKMFAQMTKQQRQIHDRQHAKNRYLSLEQREDAHRRKHGAPIMPKVGAIPQRG